VNFHLSHIPFHRLVDWVEATLSTEEQLQLQQHLERCSQCRDALAEVKQLISLMQSDQAIDPPPAVTARALRIFQPRVAAPAPSLLQRIVATLQFDTLQSPLAMGMRSGAAPSRQLLFRAGDYDLDLRLTPTENAPTWTIAGQVLGGDKRGGHVEVQNDEQRVQAPLSALNEFVLPLLPSGEYTLMVHLADEEITVESFKVGS
jgi:anti-sigma factor RsiW